MNGGCRRLRPGLHVRRLRRSAAGPRCTTTARSGPRRCGTCARRSARPNAERLITQGMRLSPPEPSFLDERNAILAADAAAGGDVPATQIWERLRRARDGLLRVDDRLRRRRAGRGLLAAAGAGGPARDDRRADHRHAPARRWPVRRWRSARWSPRPTRTGATRSTASRRARYANLIVTAPGYDRVLTPVTVAGEPDDDARRGAAAQLGRAARRGDRDRRRRPRAAGLRGAGDDRPARGHGVVGAEDRVEDDDDHAAAGDRRRPLRGRPGRGRASTRRTRRRAR